MTKKRSSYWQDREKRERLWQRQQLKNDEQFNKKLARHYELAIAQINKEVDHQFQWLAEQNGQPYAEMQKQVSNLDINEAGTEARLLVARAEKMRAMGFKPTYGDFLEEENARLRLYNATMRINRLEYLKSQVGMKLTQLTSEVNQELGSRLTDDAQKEYQRQAGIMGHFLGTSKVWAGGNVQKIVMAGSNGGTWSQRLWKGQDVLKAQLDGVLSAGFITGESNQVMARKLKLAIRDTVANQRFVTERLARTESARVTYGVQLESIKANGFEWVEWFAEPSACATCTRIARVDNGEGPGIYPLKKVPKIPDDTHPNCRCSIGSYYSDEMLDKKLEQLGFGEKSVKLTDKEIWAANQYTGFAAYDLNDRLRRGLKLDKTQEEIVQGLDSALNKLPLYTSTRPLRRSFTNANNENELISLANKIVVRGSYQDVAYTSASKGLYDPDDVFRMIIRQSKSGRDMALIRSDEGEVLFPRNTRFKVVRYYVGDDGTPIIEVVEDD